MFTNHSNKGLDHDTFTIHRRGAALGRQNCLLASTRYRQGYAGASSALGIDGERRCGMSMVQAVLGAMILGVILGISLTIAVLWIAGWRARGGCSYALPNRGNQA